MKIKKEDLVKVISGKDKGKQGKIIQVFPKLNKVVVEGINIAKKHLKSNTDNQSGQIVEFSAPLDVCKVQVICPKCGKTTRIAINRLESGEKIRICKKCKASI